MLRGYVTEDNHGGNTMIHTEIVDLAMVYRGYKPMCLLHNTVLDIQSASSLGFKTISFPTVSPSNVPGLEWFDNYVVWKDDSQEGLAKFLVDYIRIHENDFTNCPEYSQIVGKCLGYPQKDIDYFRDKRKVEVDS